MASFIYLTSLFTLLDINAYPKVFHVQRNKTAIVAFLSFICSVCVRYLERFVLLLQFKLDSQYRKRISRLVRHSPNKYQQKCNQQIFALFLSFVLAVQICFERKWLLLKMVSHLLLIVIRDCNFRAETQMKFTLIVVGTE